MTALSPGTRVAWSSYWPHRSVGHRTAHVETIRADGRRKLRYVKIARLVVR